MQDMQRGRTVHRDIVYMFRLSSNIVTFWVFNVACFEHHIKSALAR